MTFALFVYESPDAWDEVSTEQKRDLHREYHAVANVPGMIGHYRLPSPQQATTVRVAGSRTIEIDGPLADTRELLRAVYLLDSDDHDSVVEIASTIPAARMGGAVEIRPIAAK